MVENEERKIIEVIKTTVWNHGSRKEVGNGHRSLDYRRHDNGEDTRRIKFISQMRRRRQRADCSGQEHQLLDI